MKQRLHVLYTGLHKTKTTIVLLVTVVYFVLVHISGGSVWEWARLAVALLLYIVLPGLLVVWLLGAAAAKWRFAFAPPPGFGGPLAVLYGVGLFALLYCVSMYMGALWLLHVLPPLLALAWVVLAVRGLRQKRAGGARRLVAPVLAPQQWLLVLLFAAGLLVYAFFCVAKYARPLAVGNILPNQDLYWNAGNAASFTLAFPPQDIRFVGVRLHYHYLTELVAGALSLVSGVAPYNILAFYLQPFTFAALVLCLYRFGRVVWPGKALLRPLLFTYSLFLFGCASLWKILPNGWSVFSNTNIVHLVTNINSQATGILFLCVFLGLFVHASRQKYKVGLLYHGSMVGAFFLLSFAKGPLAGIVVVSVVLTLLIGLFQKRTGWRGLLLGAVLGGLFAAVYVVMFSSGANDSMVLRWHFTLERGWFGNYLRMIYQKDIRLWYISVPVLWVAQSFLMMPAQFPLYVRGLFADVRHFARLAPERLLFNGVAVGGLAAFFLFNHPHFSQVYFLYAAIFFVNLLAVDGVTRLPGWWRAARGKAGAGLKMWLSRGWLAFLAVFTAASLATAGFLYVHMLGSGARQVARSLHLSETYPYDLVMTPDDEAAMLWMKENTPQDAMFATNRIHSGANREGISNVYSALCQRQAYMEGFQYAKTNMGVSVPEIEARLAVNSALFDAATPLETVRALCVEKGISYLVFCTQMNGVDASDEHLTPLEKVFDSENVRIYRV